VLMRKHDNGNMMVSYDDHMNATRIWRHVTHSVRVVPCTSFRVLRKCPAQ
jgi:hypothetical protein